MAIIEVDPFIKHTRIILCQALSCVFNNGGSCRYKETFINADGVCGSYLKKNSHDDKPDLRTLH